MSWGAIGATVIGGALGGGGGSGGQAAQSQSFTNSFNLEGGLFGDSNFNRGTGVVSQVLDPRLAQLQGQGLDQSNQFGALALNNAGSQQAFNLGQGFAGQLSQTDPLGLQQTLFNQQSSILQPGFDQANFDLEGRLFSQGRLGSTGGALQQQAQLDSQNTAFGQLLADSFQQSQAQQEQTAGLASTFLQLDPQLSGMFQQLGTSGLNNALNINASGLDSLANAGQLSASSSSTGATADTVSPFSAVGGGLLTSGAEQFGDIFGGLFQSSPVASGLGLSDFNGPGFLGRN